MQQKGFLIVTKKLNELTIIEALKGLKAKEFTSVDLTRACFDQIEKYDGVINAYVTLVKENALNDAEKADLLINSHGPEIFDEKPLLGIPYACKDNYSTKGIETTASSNILKDYFPPFESTVTQKLKDAGAILLGKTNLDAFAHGASTENSDFYTTKNPWDPTKVPGGSSGGSGAAVISDMCVFAMGSDTGGSIRCPASWCGVTGLKPTYGRVSRYGLAAMASSTDCPGPMTKTVEDAAYVLQVIAGKDVHDATSAPERVPDYKKSITEFDIKKLKVGRPHSYFDIGMQPGVAEKVNAAVETFKKLGATIVDIDLIDPKYAIAVYTIIQRSEVSSNLARLDGIRYGHTRDAFGFEAKKRIMLGTYALSAGYYDQYYAKAQKVRTLLIEDFNKAFDKVDLIIGPTMPNVAVPIGSVNSSPIFGELTDMMQLPGSMSGLPVIAIPCGQSDNLPVGVQLIGQKFNESVVFGAAAAFQQATTYHVVKPNLEELL